MKVWLSIFIVGDNERGTKKNQLVILCEFSEQNNWLWTKNKLTQWGKIMAQDSHSSRFNLRVNYFEKKIDLHFLQLSH